jgi:hypothetical protein
VNTRPEPTTHDRLCAAVNLLTEAKDNADPDEDPYIIARLADLEAQVDDLLSEVERRDAAKWVNPRDLEPAGIDEVL